MEIQLSKSFFKRKIQFLSLLGLSISIVGCAAQSSYLDARRTEDLVQRAETAAPSSVEAEKARVAYEAGEVNLKEARYGRSALYFKEAQRLATRVLESKNALNPDEKAASEQFDHQRVSSEQALLGKDQSAVASEFIEQKKRPSLPAEALAAYLASKSASKMSLDESAEIEAPKRDILLPPKKLPRPVSKSSSVKNSSASKAMPKKPTLTGGDEALVVEASSEVRAKTPPSTGEVKKPVVVDTPPVVVAESGDEEVKSSGPEKTKLDRMIPFSPRDEALNESSMAEMDKMSRFLVENPSNTLVLKGVRGPSEGEELVAGRYDSVKSYLSARGVPDDQVRLEDSSVSGRNPGFEMFLIEH